MSDIQEKRTAAHMVEMLRAHYAGAPSKPEPGYFIEEIEAPRSSRRADAIYVPLASQLRGQIHGIEIKVSRADLVVELKDPTKADAWMRYCDRWWLAVADPAMIQGLDLPEWWGVLAPPSGRSTRLMTVVKPAPLLKPADKADAWLSIVTRMYYRGDDVDSEIRKLKGRAELAEQDAERTQERLNEAVQELAELRLSDDDRRAIVEIVGKVRRAGWHYSSEFGYGAADRVEAEDIVTALLNLGQLRRDTANLAMRVRSQREQLDRSVKVLREVVKGEHDNLAQIEQRLVETSERAS